jgi:hypothetical protein
MGICEAQCTCYKLDTAGGIQGQMLCKDWGSCKAGLLKTKCRCTGPLGSGLCGDMTATKETLANNAKLPQ